MSGSRRCFAFWHRIDMDLHDLVEHPRTEETAGEGAAAAVAHESLERRRLLSSPLKAVLAAAAGAALVSACDITDAPYSRNKHLLRRLTYGATPASLADLEAKGEAAWLAEQLDPDSIDTSAIDAKVAQYEAMNTTTAAELLTAFPGDTSAIAKLQLQAATALRAFESPAQLFERMAEFWADHFNVPTNTTYLAAIRIHDDRIVARTHALGRFKDLVVASAQSPAMLEYLDNRLSRVGSINENYGRELLELHAVGVDGGYDETDVVDTARILTGWTSDRSNGTYFFDQANHDTGSVNIMGWTRPAGTDYEQHGIAFLHWLAMRPATASFVSRKIARRFVSDDPPAAVVDAMAAAWLANDSNIASVLTAMVAHPAFADDAGGKFCRPGDFLSKTMRSLQAELDPIADALRLLEFAIATNGMGFSSFSWPSPDGPPDDAEAWLSTAGLLLRLSLTADMLSPAFPNGSLIPTPLVASLTGKTAAEIFDDAAQAFLLESPTAAGLAVLSGRTGWSLDHTPTAAEIDTAFPAIALCLLASPDAMYR